MQTAAKKENQNSGSKKVMSDLQSLSLSDKGISAKERGLQFAEKMRSKNTKKESILNAKRAAMGQPIRDKRGSPQ